tara:strand:- start:2020 stop:3189 length:1170 start_codon:yes stop_codon:yes gene_type:complete
MRKKMLVFGQPSIGNKEILEVLDTLKSGWLGTGPKVNKFEKLICKYKKINNAIAVNSCTAALHLSLLAIGIKKGDEIILPSMTFAATANAIIHAGGVPVFADCNIETLNIDIKDIEKKITKKTKAIIPVHFAGRPCEMDQIMLIAKKFDLKVVEDCAHAIETKYKEKFAGTFGDIGCLSFYVTKNVVTGEGGALITNNVKYANKIKVWALHGLTKNAWSRFSDKGYSHYKVVSPGFKYNMMDLQASLGIHQIRKINTSWQKRKKIWNYYNKSFKNMPFIKLDPIKKYMRHAYHLYIILLDLDKIEINRDTFLEEMHKLNIGVGVHYTALHLHPYYKKKYKYKTGDLKNTEFISQRTVSLPLSPKLNLKDQRDVVNAVKKIINKYYINKY